MSSLVALLEPMGDGRLMLRSPTVGLWREAPALGALVQGGARIGRIETLGVLRAISAPEGAHGAVVELGGASLARRPVDYGAPMLVLDSAALGAASVGAAAVAARGHDAGATVFRSPMSGRFYSRPAPDEAPFVSEGDALVAGQTVCLLEVMKTFNRIAYGGEHGAARITRLLVREGDDVEEGQPIFELEPRL